jgi:hypothetical protein
MKMTAGAKAYRRKILVCEKTKWISSNFNANEGKLWIRISAVCLRLLGTGICLACMVEATSVRNGHSK